jgi:SagB-type dehydrogenase family enzyme
MKLTNLFIALIIVFIGIGLAGAASDQLFPDNGEEAMSKILTDQSETPPVDLPEPRFTGDVSLEQALLQRRSVRRFNKMPLTLAQVSQLLWAAQGITHPSGFRTSPSAGALFPLEVHLVADRVEGLDPGIYRYLPSSRQLVKGKDGSRLNNLAEAGLGQAVIRQAPAAIVISGIFTRTTGKYGRRGIQYVFMEAGHAGQNILLQAVSSGLAGVPIGAFDDDAVSRLMDFPDNETPLYIIPVGYASD